MKDITDVKPMFKKCYEYTTASDARADGSYPFFKPIDGYNGGRVIIEGKEMIMAGSNNYLGLALDPRVRQAAKDAIDKFSASCSGSRYMNGTLTLHEELERNLCDFFQQEDCLLFTAGYLANLGSISALVGRKEHIVSDRFNHASIMDGIFMGVGLSPDIKLHRYKHNDMVDFEKKLAKIPAGEPILVVTDGVFSMEGDIAKLPEMREIANKYGAAIYLDEAHSVGVLGKSGKGTLEHYNDFSLADMMMCTFSKTFGSIGGFVAGDHKVIDYIRHHSRPLIFTASMPPANVASAITSLEILKEEPQRVHRLQAIAEKMIKGFKELGFELGTAETPIIPLLIGDYDKTFLFWKRLYERGIYTNPVIPPGVPPNRCLIRTSYMAIHTDEELDTILQVCAEEGRELGIIE